MDALARLEPVARPLTRAVDQLVATLGAPPEHPVWSVLRRVGATPADAIAAVADLDPARLRTIAATVRDHAGGYDAAPVPAEVLWLGRAGRSYAVRAAALDAHQRADGPDSLTGRLRATAGYLDETARWQQRSRDRLARALAEAMTSSQAVAIRQPAGRGLVAAADINAAADISAALLRAVAAGLDEGEALRQSWAPRLTELIFESHSELAATSNATIEVAH
jgi:hypothetical protein